jgi:hypothetical protein
MRRSDIWWMCLLSGCGLFGSAPEDVNKPGHADAVKVAPSDAPRPSVSRLAPEVAACLEASVAQRAAGSSDPKPVAKACAPVYKVPACRDAWTQAAEVGGIAYMSIIVEGCKLAYCDLIDPAPPLCDTDANDLKTYLTQWPALQRAIWAHDWPPTEVTELEHTFQAAIRKKREAASAEP